MGALPRSPRSTEPTGSRRPFVRDRRDQRGVALPSPVVLLTVVAVAMAGIAWFATRSPEPTEREVTPVADTAPPTSEATQEPKKQKKEKETPPPVVRSDVFVEVYNNSGITGLADGVGGQSTEAGWKVVGTDNWYGTIPATTVYYPPRLEDAAKLLALDLGIERTAPAVDPMRLDRLTVILTGPLA